MNGQRFVYGLDQALVAANRPAIERALRSVPSVMITAPQASLTGPTGIYTNALQSGSTWEAPVTIEYVDPTGATSGFQRSVGLRIKGGFSRRPEFAVHGFSLRFSSKYGGPLSAANLFGDGVGSFSSPRPEGRQQRVMAVRKRQEYVPARGVEPRRAAGGW